MQQVHTEGDQTRNLRFLSATRTPDYLRREVLSVSEDVRLRAAAVHVDLLDFEKDITHTNHMRYNKHKSKLSGPQCQPISLC